MLSEQKEIKLIEFFRICITCNIKKSWIKFTKINRPCRIALTCKKCNNLRVKAYRKTHKKEIKAQSKLYRIANKEKIKTHAKVYRVTNKEKNKEKMNNYARKWQKEKRETDPKFRLNCRMKTAIGDSLRGNKKGAHWEDLVGYTLEKLRKHLEKQFAKDMSWETYGKDGWVIDHKIPKVAFNFSRPEHKDFKKCWALNNLQPLWATDNLKKGASIKKHFQPSLLM